MRSWMLRGPALLALIFSVATALATENDPIEKLRRAAEQGDATAQFNLGLMYSTGRGVPQDYVAAHMFFNLAGAKGNEDARKTRDQLATKMTASQIAEAQRRAREWQTEPGSDGK